jgi:hypothetical protein
MQMKTSSYEEKAIKLLLTRRATFAREKTFNDLRHGALRFDFYITKPFLAILEIDGQYHFQPIRGRAALMKQQEYDRIKNSWCLAKDIPLYRVPYWELDNITKFEELFQNKFKVTSKWHNDLLKPPQNIKAK